MVAGMGVEPPMVVVDPAGARRQLRLVQATALLVGALCAAAVGAAFLVSVSTGLIALAFAPIVVLVAVLTVDRIVSQ